MTSKKIYCDHNATSPLRPEVLEAMRPYLTDIYGNASSIHFFGQQARKGLEDAREAVALLLHASSPEEIIFTGCGTESNNMVIKGVAWANRDKGNHIITSAIEHHAILYPCQYLEKQGYKVTYLPVDAAGLVNPDDVRAAITPGTFLVSIMHANNEVGSIEPIREIGDVIKSVNEERLSQGARQIYFHTDAVQAAGKLPIDVRELGVDFLSLSAHKFYGPKGVGALYCKRGAVMEPLLHGGHHERNRRSGTENVAGIAGMACALSMAMKECVEEQGRLRALRDRFESQLQKRIPEVIVNGHPVKRLGSTSNMIFRYVEGESLLLSLDLAGIAASTGSACASGSLEPSHVLRAMGVAPEDAQSALRFSFGHSTTAEDIDYCIETLATVVGKLRSMSPLWSSAHHKK